LLFENNKYLAGSARTLPFSCASATRNFKDHRRRTDILSGAQVHPKRHHSSAPSK